MPVSASLIRAECFVRGTRIANSFSTSSINSLLFVIRTAAAITSCSAWLMRSAATSAAIALSSATIAISVGPASESIPMIPRNARLAAAT